jgi:predicted RNase H-like nuclease (RuvC/YqgF family)
MAFPVFEKKEDIPKGFEDDYEEREGKFHPKVPDVTKLNSAIDKERKDRENEEKERKRLERENAELKRKQQAAENNISEEKLQELRAEDERKRREELEPIKQQLDRTAAELTKVKKTDRVQRMFLDAGGMSERLEDAMLSLDKRTGLTEDGNTITVLDKDGKLTTAKIEDFLKVDFKQEKPWLYKGSGASGSGAAQSAGEKSGPTPATNEKSLADKRAMVAGAL